MNVQASASQSNANIGPNRLSDAISSVSAEMPTDSFWFYPSEVAQFHRDGFTIVRGLVDADMRSAMLEATITGLAEVQRGKTTPVEFEAEVNYPGAPDSIAEEGGQTVRRLKQAHGRDTIFSDWIMAPQLRGRLWQLLGPDYVMPLAHHNCIMTKQPKYSSDTGWHRDMRYWSFQRPELISVWLGLGEETTQNGCLYVIPGSHNAQFDPDQLDEQSFFLADHPKSQELIARKVAVTLDPGDVLFFHCRTLHAASRNYTDEPKFSVVMTFRPADNPPQPGTRSAAMSELLIPTCDVQHPC